MILKKLCIKNFSKSLQCFKLCLPSTCEHATSASQSVGGQEILSRVARS